ncbi:MAG: lipopolysaccharide heptosyltransferase II [Pseudomonadota bacterium]
MQLQPPESILIVKLSAIGDVVHSLPFLEVLRKNFPDAKIDWLVEEDAFRIIDGHPAINRLIVSHRKSWQRGLMRGTKGPISVLREISLFLRSLRAQEYDLVIDLQGLLKSGVLAGLSLGRRKIGMSSSREGGWIFLNERPVPVDYDQHAIDRYLGLARYLGCDSAQWNGLIPILEREKERINQVLNREYLKEGPLIAINPMAKWRTKLWDPGRFASLADRLVDDLECEVIFTGSGQDRRVIEGIAQRMKRSPIILAGRTDLKELAHLYSRCRVLITTDTGPMHVAVAMGCPVVALFGPTSPWRTGPYGPGQRVIRADVDCSPCFKKRCRNFICMKAITVEEVFDAVKETVVA